MIFLVLMSWFKCYKTAIQNTNETCNILDVHLCKTCKNTLHQYDGVQRLYKAIDKMDIDRVKTLLDTEYTDISSIEYGIEQDYIEFCHDRLIDLTEKFAKEAVDGIMTLRSYCTYNFNDKIDVRPPLFEHRTSTDIDTGLITNTYEYKLPEQRIAPLKITEKVGTEKAYQLNIKKQYLNFKLPDMLTYITRKLLSSNQKVCYRKLKRNTKDPDIIKFLQLAELIVSKFPALITDELISGANHFNADLLLDLYTKYYVDKNADTSTTCYVCYSSHTSELLPLQRFCGHCKLFVHLKCLIKCIETNGHTCSICKTPISVIKHKPSNRLCFPDANVYPIPLLSNYIILEDTEINAQLHYAIAFLCVKRVKVLLLAMTHETYMNYLATADRYALHDGINVHRLKDMPYTNLSRAMYTNNFKAIETMLSLKSSQDISGLLAVNC